MCPLLDYDDTTSVQTVYSFKKPLLTSLLHLAEDYT